jgi:hypothetical protein
MRRYRCGVCYGPWVTTPRPSLLERGVEPLRVHLVKSLWITGSHDAREDDEPRCEPDGEPPVEVEVVQQNRLGERFTAIGDAHLLGCRTRGEQRRGDEPPRPRGALDIPRGAAPILWRGLRMHARGGSDGQSVAGGPAVERP